METTAQLEKKLHLFFITILGSTKVTNSYRFPPSKRSSDGWSHSFLLLPLSHFVSRALSTFLLKLGQISAQCFLLSLYTILNQSLISVIQKVRCTIGLWSKHSTGKQFKGSTKWKKKWTMLSFMKNDCVQGLLRKKKPSYLPLNNWQSLRCKSSSKKYSIFFFAFRHFSFEHWVWPFFILPRQLPQ